tara:strand:- start:14049 stop:14231 length:183 start_codon:yes stop_codon:yes gene_type:complete
MKLYQKTDIRNLQDLIDSSIVKIDNNLSVHDFAEAVAYVLIDNYGTHNFKPFIKTLKKHL